MPKPPRQSLLTTVHDRSSEAVEDVPSSGGFEGGTDGDALISLLNRLPDAVLVLDRAWRITFANQEARRISWLSSHDLNNRTHWELYPETVGTPLERLYYKVMETGVSSHTEYYHTRRSTFIWTFT